MASKTKEQISYNMRRVKNRDTKIEILLRKELWQRGLRYQKNVTSILGKPDIVFKGAKVAVFCDSEFWHGYDWENRKKKLKSNREYWIEKIEENIARDRRNDAMLISSGWTVTHFWEKEVLKCLDDCVATILQIMDEPNEEAKT